MEKARAYYPALDGLRGVAFLLVFLFHYIALPWGWVGVEMFFVLSGFLITGILYDSRDDPHRVRNFYARRTLRIFPLYYISLLIVFAISGLAHAKLSVYDFAWFFYLGNLLPFLHPAAADSAFTLMAGGVLTSTTHPWFTLRLAHFWSLCVEEQFYLCWPALIFAVRRRGVLLWICAGLIVFMPLLRFAAQTWAPAWMVAVELPYRFTPLRLDAFAYGGLLALLRRGSKVKWLQPAAKASLVLATMVLAILLGPHVLDKFHRRVYQYPGWEFTWGLVLADVVSLSLLIAALHPGTFVYRLLYQKPLRWIGRISYGAYVIHYIPISFFDEGLLHLRMKHQAVPVVMLALAFTLTLAWLSFRYLESPFIRMKSRWAH